MDGQQHGILVTLDQVYAVLLDVRDSQRDLSGSMAAVQRQVADHEDRIRAAEARRWPVPIATLLLAVMSVAWSIVKK